MNTPSKSLRQDGRPGAPLLQVTSTSAPGSAAIIQVCGDVDQNTRRTLDDALAKAIVDRPPLLVVDLAGLVFCYSTCINALLAARREASAAGVRMALAAVRPQALRVLKLTETDRLFTLHDSVHAALDGETDRPTG
ncbi:STAS domain-containing protein [Kitasatospora purpeofusca]|uniref:STAS domain-containing protein n=1 Tax=Kitasatospora purpeofusca TaxID=67352 RepID=UPI0035DD0CEC